jgi:plastocyanin
MGTMHKLKRLLLIVLLLALESVAGGASPTTAPATQPMSATTQPAAETTTVKIDNFRFDPEVVTVPVGTNVTWINHDDVPHTVTATAKSFTSAALDTDDRYSHVFAKAGEYTYYCAVHPHMTARVIVK